MNDQKSPKEGRVTVRSRRAPRIALLLIVLGAITAAYGWRYHHFRSSLRFYAAAQRPAFSERDFPCLSGNEAVLVGSAHAPGDRPLSSYSLVPTEKPNGVVRIGVFGCSFVRGSEAGEGFDFPSQLQRMFEKAGAANVQVLNFGVGAYGVQQSFLLWSMLADRFGLDHVVFNLYGFHPQRDTTFVMNNHIYAPVHARYVIDQGQLRLIRPAGGDRLEAARGYFALLPRWQLLRFDSKTPPQVRALLPRGRELRRNPFYYRTDIDAEIREIYSLMFAELARGTGELMILCNNPNQFRYLYEHEVIGSRIFDCQTNHFAWARRGAYMAPGNHLSAMGYGVIADELFGLLTAEKEPRTRVLLFDGPAQAVSSEPLHELESYEEVLLTVAGEPFALFVEEDSQHGAEPVVFKERGFAGLIDVSDNLRLRFLALPDLLLDGAEAVFSFRIGGVPVVVPLGTMRTATGILGAVEMPWTTRNGSGWELRRAADATVLDIEVRTSDQITDITVGLAGKLMLRGRIGDPEATGWAPVRLQPNGASLLSVRGHPRQNPELVYETGAGTIDLTAISADGTAHSLSLVHYSVALHPFKTPSNLPEPIAGLEVDWDH